ncbi:hypothetical protein SAMN04488077_12022 [Roseovarius tolerans]|uniref:Uncharacterized protein n=1 Tax=Roseovarius tolerans TaxID=74031 RepID=A0A1H8HHA3_9RHOB|nr:hypothetical protein [Roseovarius tolerans]SEN54898.1 hypothetical protein SAMN04488077_12022 [Roseovarius tolerans]
MSRGSNILAASAALFALAAPAVAGNMADCTYKGSISGKTATIVVQGSEPVSYRWGNYNAKKVSQDGNTIYIDAATLANLSVGATQSGKPAFQGVWRYKGNNENVTFICR